MRFFVILGLLISTAAAATINLNPSPILPPKIIHAEEAIFEDGSNPIPQGELADSLVEEALALLAPFIETSLQRLFSSIFGTGRAARSTDAVIFNRSGHEFNLVENGCGTGVWTGDLLPNYDLPAAASVTHGAESHGFLSGCTDCKVKYLSTDGITYFEIYTSNPYSGGNHAGPITFTENLKIQTIVGGGNNNIVRFYVVDN